MSTTAALSAGGHQGGCVKYATDAKNSKNLELVKSEFTSGTWNVRTFCIEEKLAELSYGMEKFNWNVLGIGEVRWTNTGEVTTKEGHEFWFSGEESQHQKGVGFLVHKSTLKSVLECAPISSRIITIRIAAEPKNITIIQIYAPTTSHKDEEVEHFYEELESAITKSPENDILIVQGDWNAQMGKDIHKTWQGTAGRFGHEKINKRGERLLEFAKHHNLVVTNTRFHGQRHGIHQEDCNTNESTSYCFPNAFSQE